MVDPSFFDAFTDGGYLPGVQSVVVKRPDGTSAVTLDARPESVSLDVRMAAGIGGGVEACWWFFAVGQANYVRPRDRWTIQDEAGDVWVAVHHDITINTRGDAILATKQKQ